MNRCGTRQGYHDHLRAGTSSCEACRQAWREYKRVERVPCADSCGNTVAAGRAGRCRDCHRKGQRSRRHHLARLRLAKAARGTKSRYVFTQGPCAWCGDVFTARGTSPSLYCSDRCQAKTKAVRRRGREFTATGTYTWTEVMRLFRVFDRCCAYCDQPVVGQPDPDHVVPLSRGGSNSITNILPCCRPCNADKRDLLLSEWNADRERRGLAPVRTSWPASDTRFRHLTSVICEMAA